MLYTSQRVYATRDFPNPANPILVELRARVEAFGDDPFDEAQVLLDTINTPAYDDLYFEGVDPLGPAYDHARRVLTRLVAFSGAAA